MGALDILTAEGDRVSIHFRTEDAFTTSPATTPSQPTALPPATLRVETEEKFVEGLTGFRSDLVLSDFQPASLRRACGARLNTDTATSRPRYKW